MKPEGWKAGDPGSRRVGKLEGWKAGDPGSRRVGKPEGWKAGDPGSQRVESRRPGKPSSQETGEAARCGSRGGRTVGKTSGSALADKYGDFLYPSMKVLAADREMPEKPFLYLESAEVTSTVGREPDMAVLVYRVDAFPKGNLAALEERVAVGQKMEVMAGYGNKLSRIFLGYLHEVEVSDFLQDYVEYTLICLDAKGLMKKNSVFQVSGSQKVQQVLSDILSDKTYRFLVKDQKVSALPDSLNRDCVVKGQTHYDWLCSLADLLNYEFYCGRGELCFRQAGQGSGELLELTAEYGLQVVRAVVSMAGQTGSVSFCGYNRKDEKVAGTAKWKPPGGAFAGKLEQSLSPFSMQVWDMGLETEEQAKARAEAAMSRKRDQCSRLEAVNIGVPELSPGVSVTIVNERADSLAGTMYVEEVIHQLDGTGYRTLLKGRRT